MRAGTSVSPNTVYLNSMSEMQFHSSQERRPPISRISRAEQQEMLDPKRNPERIRAEYIGQGYYEAHKRALDADNPLDKAQAEREAKQELDDIRTGLVDLMQEREDKDLQDTLRLAAYTFIHQALLDMSYEDLETIRLTNSAKVDRTVLATYGYEGEQDFNEIQELQTAESSDENDAGPELAYKWLRSYDTLLEQKPSIFRGNNPELNNALDEIHIASGESRDVSITADSILANITDLPDEILGKVIQSRSELLDRDYERAAEELSSVLEEITQTILPGAVEMGHLPSQVTDKMNELRGYEFLIVDELYRQFHLRVAFGGIHFGDEGHIKIPYDQLYDVDLVSYHEFGAEDWMTEADSTLYNNYAEIDIVTGEERDDNLHSILIHEIMHALSRNAAIMKDGEISSRWTGLRVYADEDHPVQFTWLNEAITERLNLLARQEAVGGYGAYRKLYAALKVAGAEEIPESIFLNAYFTDRDPSDPASEDARRELSQAISRAYSPGFLNRLDVFVREKGIDAAIAAIESDPSTI